MIGQRTFARSSAHARATPIILDHCIDRLQGEVKGQAIGLKIRRTIMMRLVKLLTACGVVLSTAAAAHAQGIDWAKIDGIFGRTGAVGGTVHRYGFPRSDLQVTLDGVTIRPRLALGGWVAFQPMGNMAMAMGDLVLLQSEVNPVMAKLVEAAWKSLRFIIICCVPNR
jgi:hypothetical protein